MRNLFPIICGIVCFATVGAAYAAQTPGDTAMAQQVCSLDGTQWFIAADTANAGREQEWFREPRPEAVPIRVPGILQEALPDTHGVVWYWRDATFPAHPIAQGRYLLRFNAVDYLADVWLNGKYLGSHEGGETPFILDATDAALPGQANRIAVRILNPVNEPIDGIVMAETPHRNKNVNMTVGGMIDSGGITESVDLLMTPPVYITDTYVQTFGNVLVKTTVHNATTSDLKGRLTWLAGPANTGESVATGESAGLFKPGDTTVSTELTIENPHQWDITDPYLYRLATRLTLDDGGADTNVTRFGFRELRVENGYFRLNGRRIFWRSSHTGNHCPVGQILPPANAPDLLRRDLIYMKASGFNAVRFIAGIPHPWQLDLCDEIGLMVYEENYAAWCMNDSPKMAERFDRSLAEMVRRDRNHPSVVIWGLLNETPDGPIFRHAVDSLEPLRALDTSRLVLLGSGRWDGQFGIGSLSNPGSHAWEHAWGTESPDVHEQSHWGAFGGYLTGAGDAHVYPATPHTYDIEDGIRNLGKDSKPVFLSEYGIGSLMNPIREARQYEQHRVRTDLADYAYFQTMEKKLTDDWKAWGFDSVYPFPEDFVRDSERLHARQRTLGFDLIRSNPKICGFNLTGLLDHGFTGEGLWTFWREWKPQIVDTLQDGWSPLRWCTFVRPSHGYVGHPFRIEIVLANEDVLAPGDYPVAIRIMGPNGCAWENHVTLTLPTPGNGEEPPMAVPVFSGDVTLEGPEGTYELAVCMERNGAPTGGRLTFYATEPTKSPAGISVVALGLPEQARTWMTAHGITVTDYTTPAPDKREVVLVGDLSPLKVERDARVALLQRVARGSVALFLAPGAFQKDDNATAWLPVKNKGRGYNFPDWLYHKECVAKRHEAFAGLKNPGIMDWDYYGPVIPHFMIEGADAPTEVIAAAFAPCHSAPAGGYAAGILLGQYNLGDGYFVVNTLNILDNLDTHPAADRLLVNLIASAARTCEKPLAALAADTDTQIGGLF